MAPIHDTDIAEERWSKAEWETYELWEKIEVRLKRRKMLIVAGAGAVFLLLSSVPIVTDQLPRWHAVTATRRLAQQINRLKRDASMEHQSFRIRIAPSLEFVVERAVRCTETSGWTEVRTGSLVMGSKASSYTLVTPTQGQELGIPGLSEGLCYDHLSGVHYEGTEAGELVGFAAAFSADLHEQRMDRISILLVKGPSGEVSLD